MQAFYPMDHMIGVSSDDVLAARCTYNSSQRNHITNMGSTSSDEMCNLYLMYYTLNPAANPSSQRVSLRPSFGSCVDMKFQELADVLPLGSDAPLPSNPTLESQQQGGFHHYTNGGNNVGKSGNTFDGIYDRNPDDIHPENFAYIESDGWPIGANQLGQVTAVDVDDSGKMMIFHRGSHVWNGR
jgi:peptidylglycine monooxygenase / peptidylamidoglycolate lyase